MSNHVRQWPVLSTSDLVREEKMEFGRAKIDHSIAVPTLAEVIARIGQDPDLAPTRRRDLVSAVTRMSELTGVDPRITPASMRFMRPLINKVRPARHGLNPKTWANLRANFRAAIADPAPRRPRQYDPELSVVRVFETTSWVT
jgi:hypothetical protein